MSINKKTATAGLDVLLIKYIYFQYVLSKDYNCRFEKIGVI
jgi:hypothetical protein